MKMKDVKTVSIGKTGFTVEEDACEMLQRYLNDIECHCEPSVRKETLEEVESRIAGMFFQKLATPYSAVTVAMVKAVMATIGQAESFGEYSRDQSTALRTRRLERSLNNRIIGGVCGGLATYFNMDVALLRVITFVLIFLGGLSLWVYLALWLIMPSEQTSGRR